MANYSSIHVHDCKQIVAEATEHDGTTWLDLRFDDRPCELSIFMPLDRAKRIADAINAVETPADVQESAE